VQEVLGYFQEWLENSEESLENFTSEKEMTGKRIENLNTIPYWEKTYGKKQDYKIHKNVHFRKDIKIVGKEDDLRECKTCDRILPVTAFTTSSLRADGAHRLKTICRECWTMRQREHREAKKNAASKSGDCDNCRKNKKLELDHLHGTTIFRGWLCRNCNTGVGLLGDTLEGLLQAAVYLEKDKSKIIETLNGIKNEK